MSAPAAIRIDSTSRRRRIGAARTAITCVLAMCASLASAAGSTIVVHDTGAPAANTCTLAQAINAANAANNLNISIYGSAAAATPGNCNVVTDPFDPLSFIIAFDPALPQTIVLDSIDNHWYGPNALPPIASVIRIVGGDFGTTLQ